nr:MAG TPA: hypothetical protein [Bacteriophage sp.]
MSFFSNWRLKVIFLSCLDVVEYSASPFTLTSIVPAQSPLVSILASIIFRTPPFRLLSFHDFHYRFVIIILPFLSFINLFFRFSIMCKLSFFY